MATRSVKLPDGRTVHGVPDTLSDDDLFGRMRAKGQLEPEGGVVGSFARGVGSGLLGMGADTAALIEEIMQRDKLSSFTTGLSEASKKMMPGPSLDTVIDQITKDPSQALTSLKHATPGQIGAMVPYALTLGRAGAARGIRGGMQMMGLGTALHEGENKLAQQEAKLPLSASSLPISAAQGALDVVGLGKLLGIHGAGPQNILSRVVKGGAAEAAVEPVQQVGSRMVQQKDINPLTSPEAAKEYAASALGGGLGGAGFGVVHHPFAKRAEITEDENLAQRAMNYSKWDHVPNSMKQAYIRVNGIDQAMDAEPHWNAAKLADTEVEDDLEEDAVADETGETAVPVEGETPEATPEVAPEAAQHWYTQTPERAAEWETNQRHIRRQRQLEEHQANMFRQQMADFKEADEANSLLEQLQALQANNQAGGAMSDIQQRILQSTQAGGGMPWWQIASEKEANDQMQKKQEAADKEAALDAEAQAYLKEMEDAEAQKQANAGPSPAQQQIEQATAAPSSGIRGINNLRSFDDDVDDLAAEEEANDWLANYYKSKREEAANAPPSAMQQQINALTQTPSTNFHYSAFMKPQGAPAPDAAPDAAPPAPEPQYTADELRAIEAFVRGEQPQVGTDWVPKGVVGQPPPDRYKGRDDSVPYKEPTVREYDKWVEDFAREQAAKQQATQQAEDELKQQQEAAQQEAEKANSHEQFLGKGVNITLDDLLKANITGSQPIAQIVKNKRGPSVVDDIVFNLEKLKTGSKIGRDKYKTLIEVLKKKLENPDTGQTPTQSAVSFQGAAHPTSVSPNPSPSSEAELPEPVFGHTGKPTRILHNVQGMGPVGADFEVVEADDLHPAAAQSLAQGRDREGRKMSDVQIRDIANNFIPAKVGAGASQFMQDGPPTVDRAGRIIGGNGRTMAIQKMYAENSPGAAQYRAMLEEEAELSGVAPETIAGMKKPVLIRRVSADMAPEAVKALAEDSNISSALSLSSTEQARIDADRFGSDLDTLVMKDTGEVDPDAVGTQRVTHNAMARMTTAEKGAMVTAKAFASKDFMNRLKAAVLHRAYGPESKLTSRISEEAHEELRALNKALSAVAPDVAKLETAIAKGKVDPAFSLRNILDTAVQHVISAREAGTTVTSKARNADMFGGEGSLDLGDPATILAEHIDSNMTKQSALREAIQRYVGDAIHAAESQRGLISGIETTPLQIMQDAVSPKPRTGIKYAKKQGLPATVEVDGKTRPTKDSNGNDIHPTLEGIKNFWKWFGDSKAVDASGRPLAVYHGTHHDITEFRPGRAGAIYFTPRREHAEAYGPNVVPAYLKISKLADLTDENSPAYKLMVKTFNDNGGYTGNEDVEEMLENGERSTLLFDPEVDHTWELFDYPETAVDQALLEAGYDGVKLEEYGNDVSLAVFKPSQIKRSSGNTGAFSESDADIRYSQGKSKGTGETPQSLAKVARKAFGKHTAKLMDMGRIRIVPSVKDLPGKGHPADVQAMTDADGVTYYVADNITPAEVPGLILHEVGSHVGLRAMVGDAAYSNLLDQAVSMKSEAADAARAAASSYPENERAEETLAYLVQNAPQSGLVRRVIAHVKQWLNSVFPGLVRLSDADMRVLATAAVRYAAENVPFVSRNSPAYAKKVMSNAQEKIIDSWDNAHTSTGRLIGKLTSLDQVLSDRAIPQEAARKLLNPLRRISGMQNTIRREANTLETTVRDAVARRPEVNTLLGDLANLATIVDHDPSTGAMSPTVIQNRVKFMSPEEAARFESDAAKLQDGWQALGKRKDGKELQQIFKDTRAWYRRTLDMFDKAMRSRFANDPNMLDIYEKFYENAKQKVYFPLSRFGDYSVSFINRDGDMEYYRFDTQTEMEKFVRNARSRAQEGTMDYGKSIDDVRRMADDEAARKALDATLRKLATSPRVAAKAELARIIELINSEDAIPNQTLEEAIKIARASGMDSPQLRKLIRNVDRFAQHRDALEVKRLLDTIPTGEDEVRQYLQNMMMAQMPSRSIMKHMMHRKGTIGYSNDFGRALSSYNTRMANQLPRLQFRTSINEARRDLEKALKAAAGIGRDDEGKVNKAHMSPAQARDIILRVNEEVEGVLSPPTISPAVSFLTSWAYRKYMATPAAAVFQTASVPLLSLPVLESRYGLGKSASALSRASSLFWEGLSVMNKDVTVDVRAAIRRSKMPAQQKKDLIDAWEKMEESGVIAHGEIQQALQGGRNPTTTVVSVNPVQKAAAGTLHWLDGLFSAGDSAPRHVTALAAYELARSTGKSHEAAIQDAIDTTYEALGDYSDVGRPAITRSNVGRIVYQFQSYSQKMMHTMLRLYKDWRKDNMAHLSPAEQKEISRRALRTMTGIMGSHALLAGGLGMPFAASLMGLVDLLKEWDDEDVQADAEADLRRFARQDLQLSEFMTRAFMEGLPGALMNVKVSSRIGAGELPLRLDFEKKTAEENMKENFYKTFLGPAGSFATDVGKGVDYMRRGDLIRAFEALTPVAITRAGASAFRLATEGVTTRQGGHILTPDELTMGDVFGQALGVSSLTATERRQEAFRMKRAEVFINDRKKKLYNEYNQAMDDGDEKRIAEVEAKIEKFNAHYTDPVTGKPLITADSLKKSRTSHEKFVASNGIAGMGININPKLLPFIVGPEELAEMMEAR